MNKIKLDYPHLQGIEFPKVKHKEVTVLIGSNHADLLIHRESRSGKEGDPIAVKTTLGWTLLGGIKDNQSLNCNIISSNEIDDLNENVKKFWTIDSYGTIPKSQILTPDEIKANEILESNSSFVNGHYEVGLLWKETEPILPNNRNIAVKRLKNLEERFCKNPEYYQMYKTQMDDYINLGYARKLTEEEANIFTPKTNYLPHHGVKHVHKPGRIRVVFDASSKCEGISLNDKLLPGKDYLNNLVSVLTKFRQGQYAIMGDIEKMFLQIKVKEEDIDALRFIWRDNIEQNISDYVMLSHVFGKKDSPCIANWSLKRSVKNETELIQNVVNDNFYMDDFLYSLSNEKDLITITSQIMSVLNTHGFRLRKFISNSSFILNSLPSSEVSPNFINLDLASEHLERTLGLIWDVNRDQFTFKPVTKTFPNTKRGMLSMISSIYDPLGILVPSLIKPKKLMQDLWKEKIEWDETIPPEQLKQWESWKNNLKNITSITLNRWFGFNSLTNNNIELNIFCDASTIAYGAVAYLKSIDDNSKPTSSFVIAKSRLAPMKEKSLTIPRLELQAAVLAVRLKQTLLEELDLPISEVKLWSDSQIVIKYIKNTSKKFSLFVMNRLNEIRLNSNISEWKYVPGSENPADMCTRYIPLLELSTNTTWVKGPSFLYDNDCKFNDDIENTTELLDDHDTTLLNQITKQEHYVSFIKWNYYSSFTKLIRHIAALMKFKRLWIAKREKSTLDENFMKLTLNDLNEAENEIYKEAQQESFYSEFSDLSNQKTVSKRSKILSLNPILHDHLLRVGGRVRNCNIPFDNKHQIILSSKHPLSKLIILEKHVTNYHTGRDQTLSILRKTVWITNAKSLIRSTLRNCMYCKRINSSPKAPIMGNLPTQRLAIGLPPFTNTGIDYFGPVIIKLNKRTRATAATAKRYGAIFTCLTTRAVHIELAGDLTTDNFILALRRFISRRGYPSEINSDNGKNFEGGERELREAIEKLDQTKIEKELIAKRIKWNFAPPLTPWMNGAMEAIVKITKRALRTVIKNSLFNEEMLATYLTEIESLINGRPLVPISDDINDLEALTPNHFLLGRANANVYNSPATNNITCYQSKWKFIQEMVSFFWKRWIAEYLPYLTERKKWQTNQRNFEVGDLVVVADKSVKRSHWPLGRIVRVIKGSDDVVRVVEVKTSQGTYTRPAAHLCLLEETKTD